jgi:NAD(P)H-flavin reductase
VSPGGTFVPHVATLRQVTDLTPDVKLFNVELDDPAARDSLRYKPGQFIFVSAFGVGESPFGITSAAHRSSGLEFAVRKVGTVTAMLHELEPGAKVGVRGPYGNFFPLDDYKGKDIYIIGGGIGMAPLRPVIHTILDNRGDYGKVVILNGARTPQDLVYASEFGTWAQSPNTTVELTVDRGDDGWQGRVALIPAVVSELAFSPQNAVTIICGPPIMIRFTLVELKKLGFADEQIVTTLEAKMKCGLGKCARCNVGDKYVCKSGPVFTFAQISEFLEQY